jgi:hypothetical protein
MVEDEDRPPLTLEEIQHVQKRVAEIKSGKDIAHKWPRGLRQKLINLDGGTARCFFCWSQQPGLAIAHVSLLNDLAADEFYAYDLDKVHNPIWLVLLCPSCHGKLDNAFYRESPWHQAFYKVFKERQERLKLSMLPPTTVPGDTMVTGKVGAR